VEEHCLPPRRVAVVGDNCIDVYVDGSPRSAVGGNALNVAVGLTRQEVQTAYVGEVGNDADGRRVLAAASEAGVGVERVHVVQGATWTAFIRLSPGGAAYVDHEDPGACGPYAARMDELDFLAGFDHVHMANLETTGHLIRDLRTRGISTSYDYGKSSDFAAQDAPGIVFASCDGDQARENGIQMAQEALRCGADLAVVTLGAGGSIALEGEREHWESARPIEPVDTLGAGDSYIATFLARRLAGESIDGAMRAASDAASATCLHWAGWPQPAMRVAPEVGRR